VEPGPWTLFLDGSSCGKGSDIGIVFISPRRRSFEFSLPIPASSTNNQAEYEAVLKGIKLLRKIKADALEIFGESMLVVNQLIGKYDCNNDIMRIYHEECLELLREFKIVSIEHIPKMHNEEANFWVF
jgi:ribonuclease HI